MTESGIAPEAVAGILLDCTACTVVALGASDRILRSAIMWMDVRPIGHAAWLRLADTAATPTSRRSGCLRGNGRSECAGAGQDGPHHRILARHSRAGRKTHL